jgi:UDP-N-acetylglucosamine 2-epimerase
MPWPSEYDDADARRLLDGLVIKRPVGYRQFLRLMAGAALIVSDSGVLRRKRACSSDR